MNDPTPQQIRTHIRVITFFARFGWLVLILNGLWAGNLLFQREFFTAALMTVVLIIVVRAIDAAVVTRDWLERKLSGEGKYGRGEEEEAARDQSTR